MDLHRTDVVVGNLNNDTSMVLRLVPQTDSPEQAIICITELPRDLMFARESLPCPPTDKTKPFLPYLSLNICPASPKCC